MGVMNGQHRKDSLGGIYNKVKETSNVVIKTVNVPSCQMFIFQIQ